MKSFNGVKVPLMRTTKMQLCTQNVLNLSHQMFKHYELYRKLKHFMYLFKLEIDLRFSREGD